MILMRNIYGKFLVCLIFLFVCNCEEQKKIVEPYNDPYIYETPEDPNAPYVREEWKEWIKNNHHLIVSLSSEDFSDLEFLDPFLQNKTTVQLGEVAHGIAEQNRIRVRLIKYLHQYFGFNVVAFESGFYDCFMTDKNIDNLTAKIALQKSLYTFWHTTDLLELYEYIKQMRHSNNPLYLAGFDIRPTGTVCSTRPQFFREIIIKIDTTFSNRIYETEYILIQWRTNRAYVDDYIVTNYDTLCVLYDKLIKLISDNEDMLGQYVDDEIIAVALQTAISVRINIDQRNDALYSYDYRVYLRDKQMADHVRFIKHSLYENPKIIIWAHNYHIQEDPEQANYSKTLGYWLNQEYPAELYTIWSLAYRGRINYGNVVEIEITKPESIEAILYNARKKQYFIDLSQQTQNEGNSWMFNEMFQSYLHSTGTYQINYIPRDQYDAIIFIDTVTQPEYIY